MQQSSSKILVLGGTGMVGSAIVQELRAHNYQTHYTSTKRIKGQHQLVVKSFADLEKLEKLIDCIKPRFIVNALLDREVPDSKLINSEIPVLLEKCNCQVIHISTNAVFKPEVNRFWTVEDRPTPVTKYGITKLAGERESQLVLRTSVVGFRVSATKKAIKKQIERYASRSGLWNGITNKELAKRVVYHIKEVKEANHYGVEHLASPVESWERIAFFLSVRFGINIKNQATRPVIETLLEESKLGSEIEPTKALQEQIKEL